MIRNEQKIILAQLTLQIFLDDFIRLYGSENGLSVLTQVELDVARTRREEIFSQLANAKQEVQKPFAFGNELMEKTERLGVLTIELNLDKKDAVIDTEPEENPKYRATEKKTVQV